MHDLLIGRNRYGFGGVQDPVEIPLAYLFGFDRDDAVTIECLDVTSGNPGKNRVDFTARHQRRLFNGFLDGVDCVVNVDDNTLAQSRRGMRADADDFHATLGQLPHRCANFGCADVQSYDDAVFLGHDSLADSLLYCGSRRKRVTT